MVKRCEHHTATGGDFKFGQAMLFKLKVLGHAAIDLAVLLDPSAKRHTLQIAFEAVIPLVIGAEKVFGIAVPFSAKAHAAVGAHVFHHIDAAIGVTHHDDRALPYNSAAKVTWVGYLSL